MNTFRWIVVGFFGLAAMLTACFQIFLIEPVPTVMKSLGYPIPLVRLLGLIQFAAGALLFNRRTQKAGLLIIFIYMCVHLTIKLFIVGIGHSIEEVVVIAYCIFIYFLKFPADKFLLKNEPV